MNAEYGDGFEITRINGTGDGYQKGTDRLTIDLKDDQYAQLFSDPYKITNATYKAGRGPIDVRVYDPMKLKAGTFDLYILDSAHAGALANQKNHWILKSLDDKTYELSDTTINIGSEQMYSNYGFFIRMQQTTNPDTLNGPIESTMSFSNSSRSWLTGVPSGSAATGSTQKVNWMTSPAASSVSVDWLNMLNKTWGPYKYVSRSGIDYGPAANTVAAVNFNYLADYKNVDIIITSDRSRWSKCVVLEEQDDITKAIGGAGRATLRRSQSLTLDNNYNLVPDTGKGFSYFPGFAVDPETGERLNIAFGEDSYLDGNKKVWSATANDSVYQYPGQTGADMKWNPTTDFLKLDSAGKYMLGGKHVIYVFNHLPQRVIYTPGSTTPTTLVAMPAYDSCKTIFNYLYGLSSSALTGARNVFENCMWVGYPLTKSANMLAPFNGNEGEILPCYYPSGTSQSSDVKIRIRVTKPYANYASGSTWIPNDSIPYYRFSVPQSMLPTTGNTEIAKTALDLINVVPNPYYAYSTYEQNQVDNKVKIVNLPAKCIISIFTPNGTLVRRINRGVALNNSSGGIEPDVNLETSYDWDLKNNKGIPVSSGMYIIHVEAPGIGEKTIKFFGVMRPADLDSF
jgi:hypothetical protein